jgi:hypothetical protein
MVEDQYALTESGRDQGHFVMSAADITDIERYLIKSWGAELRSICGLPTIMGAGVTSQGVSPHYRIEQTTDKKIALIGGNGRVRAIFRGNLGSSAYRATDFSWLADVSLSDLQASLLDLGGLPSFPGCSMVQPDQVKAPVQQSDMAKANTQTWLNRMLPLFPVTVGTLGWICLSMGSAQNRGDLWTFASPFRSSFQLRRTDDRYVLSRQWPGKPEHFVMSTGDITDIERYLTVAFGHRWRQQNGRGVLDPDGLASMGLAPGFSLVPDGPGRIAVVKDGHSPRVVMGGDLVVDRDVAVGFTRIAQASLEDLRSSMLDPEGLPLFGGVPLTSPPYRRSAPPPPRSTMSTSSSGPNSVGNSRSGEPQAVVSRADRQTWTPVVPGYDLYRTNRDGTPNNGAVPGTTIQYDSAEEFIRDQGGQLDRIGEELGRFMNLQPDGIPASFEDRSLPVSSLSKSYAEYRLTGLLPSGWHIRMCEVGMDFGRNGGAMQVQIFDENDVARSVTNLIREGLLARQ